MKRVLLLTMVIFLLSASVHAAGAKLTFTVYGNYFSIADAAYKAKYKSTAFFPEAKATLNFSGNLYLWASYGMFSANYKWTEWSNKGVIEADVAGESIADKRIMAGGLGIFVGYLDKSQFGIRFELGACKIINDIEDTRTVISSKAFVSSVEDKQSGFGLRANFGVTYGITKHLFSEIAIGYLWASDKVNNNRINLGGFRTSVGLGLRL